MRPADDDLERFVGAQEHGGTYERALSELHRGRKQTHWMWFVFPQVSGLGRSQMAQRYGITSLREAQAYVAHPVLGPRLLACATALTELDSHDPVRIVGAVDSLKLRSSMTLFAQAAPDQPVFRAVLDQFFGGRTDEATLSRL